VRLAGWPAAASFVTQNLDSPPSNPSDVGAAAAARSSSRLLLLLLLLNQHLLTCGCGRGPGPARARPCASSLGSLAGRNRLAPSHLRSRSPPGAAVRRHRRRRTHLNSIVYLLLSIWRWRRPARSSARPAARFDPAAVPGACRPDGRTCGWLAGRRPVVSAGTRRRPSALGRTRLADQSRRAPANKLELALYKRTHSLALMDRAGRN
jgi:hypothetical protein